MAYHLSFLLILTGLTGVCSQIVTVKMVSVNLGDSISIPCLYSSDYRNHVKYLCKGTPWRSCTYAVKTNEPGKSTRFSISDDKEQQIFTVTIKDVTEADTNYWCAVEINGAADVGEKFRLSATKRSTPRLFVTHQDIMGFVGGKITINCHYRIDGQSEWCKLGRSCVTWQSGSIDGTKVSIVNNNSSVFSVTMRGLTTESSGWYFCVKRNFQMPVYVTVNETPTPTMATTTAIATTGQNCGGSVASDKAGGLIITLSLLIFIVMVALFIWFMLRKHKQAKAESSGTTMDEEEVTYSNIKHERKRDQAVEEATYCNVNYTRNTSGQRPCDESDVDVMYSSVVIRKKDNVKRVALEEKDVIYSTLSQQY